jgi:VanZ family protein
MYRFLKKYLFSLIVVVAIFYLSFFTPPQNPLEEISNIDKWVHTCMYGGFCSVVWFEYLRSHRSLCWRRILCWGIVAPIAMSGAIELLQAYCTTTRSGEWMDLAANSLGVLLAAALGYFVLRPWVWRRSTVAQCSIEK